jgi:hypothetical protein
MSAMSDVERLIAIQQIQELQARRCHAIDHQDWETYEALHAPDHVSHSQDEQRWEGAKANTARVKEAMRGKTSVHHLHTPIITFESPTKATGVWSMEDHIWWKDGDKNHWLHGWGFYNETYEKRGGTWVFTRRQLQRHKVFTSQGAMIGELKTREEIDAKFA